MVVWAFHHSERSWSFIPAKVSLPGPWKHIVKISSEVAELGIELDTVMRCEVKSGTNALFWIDRWCGDMAFHARFPLLFELEANKWCKVSDRLLMYEGEICGQWGWVRAPNGQRSLKEIFAINLGVEESHLFEWNNFVPKKVGILAWRAEMERIPVLFSLAKRGVAVESIVCPVCEEELESAEHMLVSCEFAQSI
ncbi:uncharacterized protein LOC143604495 [Bidens hawaiensis]|uniref:uncharacterized protein LOC143604495 n=1 Tax=Bidens hawaiensis TaxID=980011 RepID=UPI00404B4505